LIFFGLIFIFLIIFMIFFGLIFIFLIIVLIFFGLIFIFLIIFMILDSQIVVWPAIDMWSKAKSIDPAVAAEANKWISTYRKFMPTKEDVFIRNLKEGQTFRVGCWIQENTIIRTVD